MYNNKHHAGSTRPPRQPIGLHSPLRRQNKSLLIIEDLASHLMQVEAAYRALSDAVVYCQNNSLGLPSARGRGVLHNQAFPLSGRT